MPAFASAATPFLRRPHVFNVTTTSQRPRRRNSCSGARARWRMSSDRNNASYSRERTNSSSTTRSTEQYVDLDDVELAVDDIKLNISVPTDDAQLIPFDTYDEGNNNNNTNFEFDPSAAPPHGFALADIPWLTSEEALSGVHSRRLSRPGAYAIRDGKGVIQYVGCCSNVEKRLLQLYNTVGTSKFATCQVYPHYYYNNGGQGENVAEFLEGIVDYWVRIELCGKVPVGNSDTSWELGASDKKILLLPTDTPNVAPDILDPSTATSYRSALSMRRRFIDATARPGKPQLTLLHWKPLGILFVIALITWLCYVFGINVTVAATKLSL